MGLVIVVKEPDIEISGAIPTKRPCGNPPPWPHRNPGAGGPQYLNRQSLSNYMFHQSTAAAMALSWLCRALHLPSPRRLDFSSRQTALLPEPRPRDSCSRNSKESDKATRLLINIRLVRGIGLQKVTYYAVGAPCSNLPTDPALPANLWAFRAPVSRKLEALSKPGLSCFDHGLS